MYDCLTRKTVEEYREQVLTEYSNELLGGRTVPPNDFLDIDAWFQAGMQYQANVDIRNVYKELFDETACCDTLKRRAEASGIPLKPPSFSEGWVKITGVANTVIPIDITFSYPETGIEFSLDLNFTNVTELDASGQAVLYINSDTYGSNTNVLDSSELSITSAITGIDNVAVVVDGIAGGTDEETCDELRARLISLKKLNPVAGNLDWYEEQILNYPGVTKVCFSNCHCNQCCDSGVIQAYVFMENLYEPYGIPPKSVLDAIMTEMWGNPMGTGFGKAPIGDYGVLLCATPCELTYKVTTAKSLSISQQEGIKSTIMEFQNTILCVGEKICKANLFAAISPHIDCLQDVEITGACLGALIDNTYQLDCGAFPVLGDVEFC